MNQLLKKSVILVLFFQLWGCSFPKPKPTLYLDVDHSIIALVLGEGLARSFATVGVIKALEEADIPIHMVIGSGMGSLIGALYANKRSANDLEWHAMTFTEKDYFDTTLLGTSGLISGTRIKKFLKKRLVHSNLESLPIPFIAATTNLKTAKLYLFEKGAILKAVQAGMAIPGVFKPVEHNQMLLVSGDVSQGIPVDVAIQKGADLVIAVDLTQGIKRHRFSKPRDITIQSYQITLAALSQEQLKKAHIVIRPDVSHIDLLDFSRKREAMLAGYNATQDVLPELREILNLQEEEKEEN